MRTALTMVNNSEISPELAQRVKENAKKVLLWLTNFGSGEYLNPMIVVQANHLKAPIEINRTALSVLERLSEGRFEAVVPEEFSAFEFLDGGHYSGFFRSPLDGYYRETSADNLYPVAVRLDKDLEQMFGLNRNDSPKKVQDVVSGARKRLTALPGSSEEFEVNLNDDLYEV